MTAPLSVRALAGPRPPRLVPCRDKMLDGDAHDLASYFGPAGGFGRSTLGPQLDRAEPRYTDSAGHIIDVRRIVSVQRELAGSTPEHPRFARLISPWPYQYVRKEQSCEGVEPEDRDEQLQLAARVSRRLALLSAHHRAVLELLYGDQGCRWEQQKQREKQGQGRIWALVPSTLPARRALARDDQERAEEGRPRAALQPSERLAELARRRPRPVWLDAALDLAERERRGAEGAWGATG